MPGYSVAQFNTFCIVEQNHVGNAYFQMAPISIFFNLNILNSTVMQSSTVISVCWWWNLIVSSTKSLYNSCSLSKFRSQSPFISSLYLLISLHSLANSLPKKSSCERVDLKWTLNIVIQFWNVFVVAVELVERGWWSSSFLFSQRTSKFRRGAFHISKIFVGKLVVAVFD